MAFELVNKNSLLELAVKGPEDDTSSIWWVTLKALRRLGFNANEMGKGIAIILRGTTDGIIRDNDARIETFLHDARTVKAFAQGRSESLGEYHSGLAFSLELYADRRSYSPIYGFVPANRDPVELCRNYLFSLQDLVRETNLPALQQKLALESGGI